MDICTFWFGDTLRYVDRLCLASMVMTGQRVKLYAHGVAKGKKLGLLPAGVELCEAEEILPLEVLYRLDPDFPDERAITSIVQFSDFFRVMLMKYKQGVWLDSDVYLVKPFHPDPAQVWLAREDRSRLGVSAFYLPPDNPIIGEFEHYLSGGKVVPDWLGFKRRILRPLALKIKGQALRPNRLGTTIFGNDGISRLAKRHGFFSPSQQKEHFYYWTGHKAERIFDPAFGLEPLEHPSFIGFHIHRKTQTQLPPQKGSFFDWAVKRVAAAL